MKKIIIFILFITILIGCKPESLEFGVNTTDQGFGIITNKEFVKSETAALYDEMTKDPRKLRYGLIDNRYIDINGIRYIVDWNQDKDYLKCKIGQNVQFQWTGWGIRVGKSPQKRKNYRVIKLTFPKTEQNKNK